MSADELPGDGWRRALIVTPDSMPGAELWHKTVEDGELSVAIEPRRRGAQHRMAVSVKIADDVRPALARVVEGREPVLVGVEGGGRLPRLDELAEIVNRFTREGSLYGVVLTAGREPSKPAEGWPRQNITLLLHLGDASRVAPAR